MRYLPFTLLLLSVAACQPEKSMPVTSLRPNDVTVRTHGSPNSTPAYADDHLGENARIVLEKYCGQCHISHYETAVPAALRIFDLARADWSKGMTEDQLESSYRRLTGEELPGGAPNDSPQSDRDLIRRFVDREIMTVRARDADS